MELGLERRGLAVERGVLLAETVAVLSRYRERGGLLYNRCADRSPAGLLPERLDGGFIHAGPSPPLHPR